MEQQIVNIPANYTDAGRILGLFEIRNVIEAAVISIPCLVTLFTALPFGLTTKIVLSSVIVIPAGGFALIGIQDFSLLTFLKIYYNWRKKKRILTYRG